MAKRTKKTEPTDNVTGDVALTGDASELLPPSSDASPIGDTEPATEAAAEDLLPPSDLPLPPSAEPSAQPDPPVTRRLTAPLGHVPMALVESGQYHLSRHVEVGYLSDRQALALRRLVLGLDAENARLANGNRVSKAPDAIRWLLERLGE